MKRREGGKVAYSLRGFSGLSSMALVEALVS